VATNLLLWDDDLTAGIVVSVWNGMVEETDCPDDLSDLLDSALLDIRRVTVELN